MTDTLMKEKPIFPLLASMALPMVFSMLVNALYNIVDSFFVAQISEDAMTALSLVYPMQNLINAIAIGFGVGINGKNEADDDCTYGGFHLQYCIGPASDFRVWTFSADGHHRSRCIWGPERGTGPIRQPLMECVFLYCMAL